MCAAITPTTPSCPQLFDAHTMKRIEYRVRRMGRTFELCPQECEDVQQDMLLALVRASKRFDPAECQFRGFVRSVLDQRYKHLIRQYSARKELECYKPLSLEDLEPEEQSGILDPAGERCFEAVDLQADLPVILASMPENLRRICELLMVCSGREAALRLGVAPSTILRAIPRIRSFFVAAGYEFSGGSRNRRASGANKEL